MWLGTKSPIRWAVALVKEAEGLPASVQSLTSVPPHLLSAPLPKS